MQLFVEGFLHPNSKDKVHFLFHCCIFPLLTWWMTSSARRNYLSFKVRDMCISCLSVLSQIINGRYPTQKDINIKDPPQRSRLTEIQNVNFFRQHFLHFSSVNIIYMCDYFIPVGRILLSKQVLCILYKLDSTGMKVTHCCNFRFQIIYLLLLNSQILSINL